MVSSPMPILSWPMKVHFVFFPSDDASLGKAWFLKTFIAWLNLDFELIERCFVQGLTAYAKTWLHAVCIFPL